MRDRVWPAAKKHGFTRQGRRFYKENVNQDLVQIWFRPMASGRGYDSSLRVTMVLLQGISRRLEYRDAKPLPNEFSETGQWVWNPEIPIEFRRPHSVGIWDEMGQEGFEEAFEREAIDAWFPTMDQLIEPGSITRQLQNPDNKYPGRFIPRSDVSIALSLLNDGEFSTRTKSELVNLVATEGPVIADRIRAMFSEAPDVGS